MPMKPPQKRFKVTLVIEAWDWEDVVRETENLAMHLEDHGPVCASVMGGGSVSHTVRVEKDEDITRERWASDLDDYLESLKGRTD
jgi:hypothetical protein